jgi:hypothetical protein
MIDRAQLLDELLEDASRATGDDVPVELLELRELALELAVVARELAPEAQPHHRADVLSRIADVEQDGKPRRRRRSRRHGRRLAFVAAGWAVLLVATSGAVAASAPNSSFGRTVRQAAAQLPLIPDSIAPARRPVPVPDRAAQPSPPGPMPSDFVRATRAESEALLAELDARTPDRKPIDSRRIEELCADAPEPEACRTKLEANEQQPIAGDPDADVMPRDPSIDEQLPPPDGSQPKLPPPDGQAPAPCMEPCEQFGEPRPHDGPRQQLPPPEQQQQPLLPPPGD